MPDQFIENSPLSIRSRRSSSSVSSETLKKSSNGGGAGMNEGGRVRRKRRSRIPIRQATGLYVHSSPPTVVPVHPSIVRQWLRGGEISRLQDIVLKGQGSSLVGEYSPDSKARAFINALPRILKKIEELHEAARAGKIESVDSIVKSEPRISLELSRDNSGTGILHKAVIHGHAPMQEWLLKNYPRTVDVLDKEKRNPLHYASGNEEVWNRLVAGGADTTAVDREGYSPAFYMNHPRRLRPPAPESRSKAQTQASQGLVVKPSNIRIWIHDKDLGRLQRVMWEGMGDKLKTETSSQPLVRRFLNAVPYIMSSIRDVHTAAVNNDTELLLSKSSDPVPKDILLSKDANGLNPLHKASGLGNLEVARAIIERAPESVNAKDHLDRTPLHYAAAAKDQNIYQLLVDSNATDHLEDKKGNTPSHYRAKPSELEGVKLLNVIPDAPRTAHIFPPSWDWRLLTGETSTESPMTSPQANAPPPIPKAKEPEEAVSQVEEKIVDEQPPEIEPSPEAEAEVEPGESKEPTEEPLGISDDEGVGSEVNPSIENTSTPLSDTVNEEEEIDGARLGETMTLTSSLFNSETLRIEESGNGADSGTEEGDEGRVINNENGEVEASESISPSQVDNDPISTTESSVDLPTGDSGNAVGTVGEEKGEEQNAPETLTSGDQIENSQLSGDVPEGSLPNIPRDSGRTMTNSVIQPSPETDIVSTPSSETFRSRSQSELTSQEEDANERNGNVDEETETPVDTEDVVAESTLDGEQTDNQNSGTNSNSISEQAGESVEVEEGREDAEGDDSNDNQNLGSTRDLNSTYTKISSIVVEAVDERDTVDATGAIPDVDERPLSLNQSSSKPGSALQRESREEVGSDPAESNQNLVNEINQISNENEISADSNQNLDGFKDEGNLSTPQAQNGLVSSDGDVTLDENNTPNEINQINSNSRSSSRITRVETPQERPSSVTNDTIFEGVNAEDPDLETEAAPPAIEESNENEVNVGSEVNRSSDDADIENTEMKGEELAQPEDTETSNNVAEVDVTGNGHDDDFQRSEDALGNGNPDVELVANEEEDANEEDDGQDLLDRPVTTRSAGGSRAEILAITPAPDENDESETDDQKAVTDENREEDRAVAEELVAAGDMESMAEMVLNGRGSALLNMNSPNPDVQLFINNIPQYIAKIERVHGAAREGDLRGVQTALDRRKFAVARDNSTPLKPTPLHVAALFGRTSVLRYLAGRFPESMHAQDAGGRTALHYAATLPDNGHFYSLLITLGADKSVIDNEGRTADYYLKNKGELSREELLNEYQNRPVPVDTSGLNFNRFSDKVENDQVSSRKDVDDQALLTKMDACLRLIRMRASGTLLNRILGEDVYQELKFRSTRLDNTLLDLITPGVRDIALGKSRLSWDQLFTGLNVPDYESFAVFEEVLHPLVREINNIDENEETPVQPPSDYFGTESKDYFLKMNVDPSGMILKSFTVEISRNLQVATLPKNLKLSELEKVEVAVTALLTLFYKRNKESTFIDDSGENYGSYYSLSEVIDNKEVFEDLKQEDLLAEGMNEPLSDNWPYGRGVFVSPYGDLTAWVNVRDHLKLFVITSAERSGAVGEAYNTAIDVINLLEERMESKRNSKLGYLTSDPTLVGNALRFKSLLNLPHLSHDKAALMQLCKEQRLIVRPSLKNSQYRVYSTVCLGITEIESFQKYVESLNIIIEAERNQMKGTIMQIPNILKTLLHKKPK